MNGEFLLGDPEKSVFRRLMREYATFSGVGIVTHCLLDNHFHILVEVPCNPKEELPDEPLLERLSAIYGRGAVAAIRKTLEELAADPNRAGDYKEYRETFLRRMWDVSKYMKVVKQCFTQWFNAEHDRTGTLWESRFGSVLVEGTPEALSVIAAYIDLNSIRAGAAKIRRIITGAGTGKRWEATRRRRRR